MNFKTTLLVAATAVSLGACSSIANGNNQAVKFNTGEVKGADCTVTGGRDGEQFVEFQTPAEVQIRRAKAAIDVECKKDGFKTANRTVESKMEGTTAGNVLAGGFIGLGVDAMTGSMFKYPDTIMLEMEPLAPTVTGEPVAEGESVS